MRKLWSEIVQNTPMILAFILGARLFATSVVGVVLVIVGGMAVGALLIELMSDSEQPIFDSIHFGHLLVNTVIFSTAALPLAWYYSVDLGPISLLTDTLLGLAVGVLMGRLQLPQVENTFEQRLAHMLSMSIMAAVITNGVRFSLATSDSIDSLLRASLLAVLVSMVIVIAKSMVQQVTARAS